MPYVDGFLLPVPSKNLDAYRRMAASGAKVWRDHGALEYKECVGDDVNPTFGLPFPKLMKLKPEMMRHLITEHEKLGRTLTEEETVTLLRGLGFEISEAK